MSNFQRFIIKRLVITVGLTLAAVTIIFLLLRAIPGSPFVSLMTNPGIGPEQVAAIEARYGLDQPIYVQYFLYMKALLTFDFGHSIKANRSVWEILAPALLNSLIVLVPGLVVTGVVSSLLGMYVGWHRGSWIEKSSIVTTTIFRSTPVFITGILLLIIFSYELGWFPTFGMRDPVVDTSGMSFTEKFLNMDFLYHYTLPFVTTALFYSGDFLLLARNGVVERKGSPFLKLHKVKGLSENEQLLRAGRNSMIPIVTYFALRLGMMFQGLILLEVVFAWPGVGRQLVLAISQQDFPVVQAAVFVMALAVILGNFLADVMYGYLDPTLSVGD